MSDALADKEFYDSEVEADAIPEWANEVRYYADNWIGRAGQWFAGRTDVRALDLGAGSCTTSLVLSREKFVAEIVAADLSIVRMQRLAPRIQALFGGDLDKLNFVAADMNEALDFPDNHFDLIIMDAALHHSRNIWATLSELSRLLKPGGIFVAQREAFTSPLTNRITFKRLLASPEVAAGVSENAYLPSQYDYYLRVHGFEPEFIPVYHSLKFKLLFFLNGIAFSKYNIVARNTKAG